MKIVIKDKVDNGMQNLRQEVQSISIFSKCTLNLGNYL